MLYNGSFKKINNFGLYLKQFEQTPEPIITLLALWLDKLQSDDQKDKETLNIIQKIEGEGRQDPYYFTKIENLLVLQTLINFIRDRLEQLTESLRNLVEQLSLRKSVCYDEDEYQQYLSIEQRIQLYLKQVQQIYPLYVTVDGSQGFQTQTQNNLFQISKKNGLLDTILLSHQSETIYLVFSLLHNFGILEELQNEFNSHHYSSNKLYFYKWQAILSSYQSFMFDNDSLGLDFDVMRIFRDQPFYEDYRLWRKKHDNFINQAFINSFDSKINDKPFTDDINLHISFQNQTCIKNIQTQYGAHYEPLLLAKKVFHDERDEQIEDVCFTSNYYFYILASNLAITKNIQKIDQRKWIALIHLFTKQKKPIEFEENQYLVQFQPIDKKLVNQFYKYYFLFCLGKGFGDEFDKTILQLTEGNEVEFCVQIENSLLEKYKKNQFKDGLENFFLLPITKVVTHFYDDNIKPFIVKNGTDQVEPLILIGDSQYLNIERSTSSLSQSLMSHSELYKRKLQYFVTLLKQIKVCQEKKIKNQEILLQLTQIQTQIIHFFKLLLYGALWLHNQNMDKETRAFLNLLQILYQVRSVWNDEFQELFFFQFIQFLFNPLPNNPFFRDSQYMIDGTKEVFFERFRFKIQNSADEMIPQQLMSNEIRVICPYFIDSIIRIFNDTTNISNFYDELYKKYIQYEEEGKLDLSKEISRMIFIAFDIIKAPNLLDDEITKFQIFYMRTKYCLSLEFNKSSVNEQCNSMCSTLADLLPISHDIKNLVDTEYIFQNLTDLAVNLILHCNKYKCSVNKAVLPKLPNFRERIFQKVEQIYQILLKTSDFEISQYEQLQDRSSALITKSYLQQISIIESCRCKSFQLVLHQTILYLIQENALKFSLDEVVQLYQYFFKGTHYLQNSIDYSIRQQGEIGEQNLPWMFGAWEVFRREWKDYQFDGKLEGEINQYNSFVELNEKSSIIFVRSFNFVYKSLYNEQNSGQFNNIRQIFNAYKKQNCYNQVIIYLQKSYKNSMRNEFKSVYLQIPKISEYLALQEMKTLVQNYCSQISYTTKNYVDYLVNQQEVGKYYSIQNDQKSIFVAFNHNRLRIGKSSAYRLKHMVSCLQTFLKDDNKYQDYCNQFNQSYILMKQSVVVQSFDTMVQQFKIFTDEMMSLGHNILDLNIMERILQFHFQFLIYKELTTEDYFDGHYLEDKFDSQFVKMDHKEIKNDCRFQFVLIEYVQLVLKFHQNSAQLDIKFQIHSDMGLKFYGDLIENQNKMIPLPKLFTKLEFMRMHLTQLTSSAQQYTRMILPFKWLLYLQLSQWTQQQKQDFVQYLNQCIWNPVYLQILRTTKEVKNSYSEFDTIIREFKTGLFIRQMEELQEDIKKNELSLIELKKKYDTQELQHTSQNLKLQNNEQEIEGELDRETEQNLQKSTVQSEEIVQKQQADELKLEEQKVLSESIKKLEEQNKNLSDKNIFFQKYELFLTHFSQILDQVYLDVSNYDPYKYPIVQKNYKKLSNLLESSFIIKYSQQTKISSTDLQDDEFLQLQTETLFNLCYGNIDEKQSKILNCINPQIVEMFKTKSQSIDFSQLNIVIQLSKFKDFSNFGPPAFLEQCLINILKNRPQDRHEIYCNSKAILKILSMLVQKKRPEYFQLNDYTTEILDQINIILINFPEEQDGVSQKIQVRWIAKINKFLNYLIYSLQVTQSENYNLISVYELYEKLVNFYNQIDIRLNFGSYKYSYSSPFKPMIYLTQFLFSLGLKGNFAEENIKFLMRNIINKKLDKTPEGIVEISKNNVSQCYQEIQLLRQANSGSNYQVFKTFKKVFERRQVKVIKTLQVETDINKEDNQINLEENKENSVQQAEKQNGNQLDTPSQELTNDFINQNQNEQLSQTDNKINKSTKDIQIQMLENQDQYEDKFFYKVDETSQSSKISELSEQSFKIIQQLTSKYFSIQKEQLCKLIDIAADQNSDPKICFGLLYSKNLFKISLIPLENCLFMINRLIQCYPLIIDQVLDQEYNIQNQAKDLLMNSGIKTNLSFLDNLILFDTVNKGSSKIFLTSLLCQYRQYEEEKYDMLVAKINNSALSLLIQIVDKQDLENLDQAHFLSQILRIFDQTTSDQTKQDQKNSNIFRQILISLQRLIFQAKVLIQHKQQNLQELELLNDIKVYSIMGQIYKKQVQNEILLQIQKFSDKPHQYLNDFNEDVFKYYQNKYQNSCFISATEHKDTPANNTRQQPKNNSEQQFKLFNPTYDLIPDEYKQKEPDIQERQKYYELYQNCQEIYYFEGSLTGNTVDFNEQYKKKYCNQNKRALIEGFKPSSKIFRSSDQNINYINSDNDQLGQNIVEQQNQVRQAIRSSLQNKNYDDLSFIFEDIEKISADYQLSQAECQKVKDQEKLDGSKKSSEVVNQDPQPEIIDCDFVYFLDLGYQENSLQLYSVDETIFWSSNRIKREQILEDARNLYERKQLQQKHEQYLTPFEQDLTNHYINNLKSSHTGKIISEGLQTFLQSDQFQIWFDKQSQTVQQLFLSTCDVEFISLLPHDMQTIIKDQWRSQCKLVFKKQSQSKYNLDSIYQNLSQKYDQIQITSQEKVPQQKEVDSSKDLFDTKSADQFEQIEIQVDKEQQNDQSEKYYLEKVKINDDLKISRGLQKVLDTPEFFKNLYRIDIMIIEKVLQLLNCNNSQFDHQSFLQQFTLNPFTSQQIIMRSYIKLNIDHQLLNKALKNNFKQFSDLDASEQKFNFVMSDEIYDCQQGYTQDDWIQAKILDIKAQYTIFQFFQSNKIFEELILVNLNDSNFWIQLKDSTSISMNFDDRNNQILFKDPKAILYQESFSTLLNSDHQENLKNLCSFEIITQNVKLLSKLKEVKIFQKSSWTDQEFSDQFEWNHGLISLTEKQSIQFSLKKYLNDVKIRPYEFQEIPIRENNILNVFLPILLYDYQKKNLKDHSDKDIVIELLKYDFKNVINIAQSLIILNLQDLQKLFDELQKKLIIFQQEFNQETQLQNLNDAQNLSEDQFYQWKHKYNEVLYSCFYHQYHQVRYAKRNLQFFKRQIRTVVDHQLKENPEFFLKAKKENGDKIFLLNVIEEQIQKLEQPLYLHLYDTFFKAKDQIILDILETIGETVKMINKIQFCKYKQCVDSYQYMNVAFKSLIIFYELEVKTNSFMPLNFGQEDSYVTIIEKEDKVLDDLQEFQTSQQNEETIVPSPPPKLSRLFTREDTFDQPLEILQSSKTKNIANSVSRVLSLRSIYNQFVNKSINFAIYLRKIDWGSSKIWGRLLNQNSEKLGLDEKINSIKTSLQDEVFTEIDDDKDSDLRLKVDRDYLWQSTLAQLSKYSIYALIMNPFNIKFGEEQGIDQGGLSAEWITLVIKEVMDPDVGLFELSANNITSQPNPHSHLIPNHLTHFRYLGRLIAAAILKDLPIQVDLTRSVLKHITKQNMYIADLADIDLDISKNLLYLLDIDVEPLELTYNHYERVFGELICLDLGKGFDTPVTNENKKEYVKQVANYKMTLQIKEQIESLVGGFEDVIPRRYLKSLDYKELGLKLSGLKTIDMEDFKNNIILDGFAKDCIEIQWVIDIMQNDFTEQQKANLLFFITGSFKVHHGGFKEMRIKFMKLDNEQSLPVAHTCFKRIDLPAYKSRLLMKEKLTMAIEEGTVGFHIW